MPAWLVLTASIIVPGSGHLLLRRYLRGAVFATLYVAAVNVLFISLTNLGQEWGSPVVRTSLMVAAAAWLAAVISGIFILKRLRDKGLHDAQDARLREAQTAWLRDDLDRAETLLRKMIAVDARDIEAWVHLGKVLKTRGDDLEARRCFRSALNITGSRPWRWELRRELGEVDITPAEIDAS